MLRSSALIAVLAVLATACAPSCDRTCRKLSKCAEDGSTITRVECEEQCGDLLQKHDEEEDDASKELFAAHRRCVVSATCDEIADGECYDETLFAF
ncbi:MAG: hypothetical protein EP330_16735 [Deltaproteobacteria bacterium]|nr:MAG: hypothetical protein EP330_16735 [Deltaproteobacteria bacterium]